jgi:DNA repair protein RadD
VRDLRQDQKAALGDLRNAVIDGKRRIVMQCPTAWGKTVLAAGIIESARARNKKVLFTVPAIELVDQTLELFAEQKITDVGVIQASHHLTDWSQPVQIASVQTLMKRTLPQADIVLIDECHKWFKFYGTWMGTKDHKTPGWENVPFIGLSATPWTKGLGSWYEHFHKASTTREMIDAGHLSGFEVFAPTHPDLSGVATVAGDYHEGQLSERMSQSKLVGDVVQTWLDRAEGRSTLCYAVDRAHARHLQQRFEAAGVRCGYVDAHTPDVDKRNRKTEAWTEGRKTIKRKFHSGEYPVVVSIGTLTTGVDWDVRCISMARPTKSEMLFVQIVGRGLRNANGKDHCLILDHSDNHMRLGFVTDIDESYTGLHDGKAPTHANRVDGILLPKECPQCAYLKPPKMAKCPACGFLAQVQNKVKEDAGELRLLKPPEKKKKNEGPVTMEEKAVFYAELCGYAMQHNYKAGWAANKYRERCGVWPNAFKNIVPIWPKAETVSWIKSRAIAWAKSKARAAMQQGIKL